MVSADEPVLRLWEERLLTLRAGATAQMVVRASVRDGHAVIARADPKSRLLALSLKLERTAKLTLGNPVYPQPEPLAAKLADAPADTQVYRGTIMIRFSVSAPAQIDPGPHEIKGLLSYQACDAQRCLPAEAIPVELSVTIRDKPAEL
jgi:hypothetical protein